MGNGVKSIGFYAFRDCISLTNIIIGSRVTSIGDSAFGGCNNLTIYCEAQSKPDAWQNNWSNGVKEVVWGYQQ